MYTRRSNQLFLPLLLAVMIFLGLIAVMGSQALAVEAPASSQPQADTTATAIAGDQSIFEPFPSTEGMTDTVRAVLEEYERVRAENRIAAAGPVAIPNGITDAYLPVVRYELVPTQVPPTAVPPTAVPPTAVPPTEVPPTAVPPTPRPVKRADVAVTLWPAPSIRVARGGTLAYEIRVKNYGEGAAGRTDVRLPYTTNQMQLYDSRLPGDGDWVSEKTNDRITVTFGRLAAGEKRVATLYFRVNNWLADNTVINMRPAYSWSDSGSGGSATANWAPILVGGGNDSAPWVWLRVDPVSGYAGTTHHFFSDRFIPGEGIVTWLNTPSGVQPLELRGTADGMGRVWLDFRSSGLKPGTYSLVLYGARSNLTAVATFYVW